MTNRSFTRPARADQAHVDIASGNASGLRGKHVLIAGLGNIGSALALSLANLGIQFIRLIDRDYVEPQNARNQAYDRARDTGQAKVDAIAARIRAIDPCVMIESFAIDLDATPLGLFEEIDLCFGCLDSLLARQILVSRRAWPLGVPVIDGAVDGSGDLIGRVQTIVPGGACLECAWGSSHYRQIAQETPCQPQRPVQHPPTLAPARLGQAVAALMIQEAARVLLSRESATGREIAFDLTSGRSCVSRTRPAAGCRFDHAAVRERISLGRSFCEATLGDVLRAAHNACDGNQAIQFEFPRPLAEDSPFGSSRWVATQQLAASSDCLLAELSLSRRDRIRVRSPGHDAFLVLEDLVLDEVDRPRRRAAQ